MWFILYETKSVFGNLKKSIFGYTKDKNIAISELSRLCNIDPYQTKYRYSLEMDEFKPMIGYELKEVKK